MSNRREFMKATASITGALGLGLSGCSERTVVRSVEPNGAAPQKQRLSLLILGGTGFIGPHMVRYAVSRGHSVTLFNRGRSNVGLFPELETLIGDRDGKLEALEGRSWDAVIDNSGYVPRHVRDSATLLSKASEHYLFISSISAYQDLATAGIDEGYPLAKMPDETVEQVTGETYGPMKALCEKAVTDAFPTGSTVVRPGFIVGPGDKSDRWTYWPVRTARGGIMLVPGSPDDPVQIIDARDLAGFVIRALENRTTGIYNAVGPAELLNMGQMLNTMRRTTDSNATFTWADPEKLTEQNVSFPIWASVTDDEYGGAHQVSHKQAMAAGLTFKPLQDTVSDTLQWWQSLDEPRRQAMRSGLRVAAGDGRPPALSMDQQLELEAKLLRTLT